MSISRAEFSGQTQCQCSCPCHQGVYQTCWCHCKKPSFAEHPFTKTLQYVHPVSNPNLDDSIRKDLEIYELCKTVRALQEKVEKLAESFAQEAEACRDIIFQSARRSEKLHELQDRVTRLEAQRQKA